jgi:hypothetical protein
LTRFYVVRKLATFQPSPMPPRITAAKPNQQGEVKIEWSSQPGSAYRVVAKDGLDANFWWPASEVLVATDSTTAWTDVEAWLVPARFYRVEWILVSNRAKHQSRRPDYFAFFWVRLTMR